MWCCRWSCVHFYCRHSRQVRYIFHRATNVATTKKTKAAKKSNSSEQMWAHLIRIAQVCGRTESKYTRFFLTQICFFRFCPLVWPTLVSASFQCTSRFFFRFSFHSHPHSSLVDACNRAKTHAPTKTIIRMRRTTERQRETEGAEEKKN